MILTTLTLGPFQTSKFTCAESNANEKNLLFSLICIRFGTCKVRRLKRALLILCHVLQRKFEKCTKNRGARAEPSFLLTSPFVYGRVLVA